MTRIDLIYYVVAEAWGLTIAQIKSSDRHRPRPDARKMIGHFILQRYHLTLAAELTGIHHSTLLSYKATHQNRYETESEYREIADMVEVILGKTK